KENLEAIFTAIKSSELGENKFSSKHNKDLAKCIRKAKRDHVPMNYISRCIDLAKQGVEKVDFETFDTDWNSEAYATVGGQNSNNSVRIPNSFFKALENDDTWELISRTSGKVARKIKARDLWEKI